MSQLDFEKWHGIGNDFVIFDFRQNSFDLNQETIKKICNRNCGVGCDQLITLHNSRFADVKMKIFNADGSTAEFCGNATRCVAKKIRTASTIESDSLILKCSHIANNVEITLPNAKNIFEIGNGLVFVDIGNPHVVKIFKDIDSIDIEYEKSLIGSLNVAPNDYNFECVEVTNKNFIKMRVFERGSGETLACGSGAAAAFLACNFLKLINTEAEVSLIGGNLDFKLKENEVIMTGSAEKVFSGSIII